MSQKNFKRARQLARKISTGLPANGLVGTPVKSKRYNREVLIAKVAPGTTRHIYKQFKKLMRQGISIAQLETGILARMEQNGNPA